MPQHAICVRHLIAKTMAYNGSLNVDGDVKNDDVSRLYVMQSNNRVFEIV